MAGSHEIHVAVGVVRRGGKVLIARRPKHLHQGGLLEFPGGKVEPGESVQEALVREIREETGLRIVSSDLHPLIGIRHDYGDKRVFLDVWETSFSEGEPQGREGQAIGWRDPFELSDNDFPAANRPIIRALRLPTRYAITGSASGPDDYLRRLEHALANGGQSLCLLRTPELVSDQYRQLASQVLEQTGWGGEVRWMLHGSPEWLGEFPSAAGLHMPWRVARRFNERPIDEQYLLAVSCHSAEEIRHALQIGADFITLGPVNPTMSHPGAEPMGAEQFRALLEQAPVVAYGLGGLGTDDEYEMRAMGARGIAGIGFWWPSAAEKPQLSEPDGSQI